MTLKTDEHRPINPFGTLAELTFTPAAADSSIVVSSVCVSARATHSVWFIGHQQSYDAIVMTF